MEKETLKKIFNFLEKNDNIKTPLMVKFMSEMPLTKEELNVKGNLNLEFTTVTSLPEGLKVGGYLDLSNTNITSLPERLEVAGNLYLDHSFIKSLPKDLKVGGTLYIYKSPLKEYTNEELREMVKPGFLKGDIYRG